MFDLEKLPGLLTVGRDADSLHTVLIGVKGIFFARVVGGPDLDEENFARFITDARNAYEIMRRRGWGIQPIHGGKFVVVDSVQGWVFSHGENYINSCPFAALIAADAWHRKMVEMNECKTFADAKKLAATSD